MDGFSQRALPVTFFPVKPKTIVAGITQEQLQVINANTIPQPTPFGTEIQFYLPQLGNTFLDCATTYLLFQISASFQASNNGVLYANLANGAVLGSFYSFFQRLTIYANSVNVTDDIWELGIVACYYLKLTMSKQAREAMSWIMGFNPDPFGSCALTTYRVKGPFPMCAEGDALAQTYFAVDSATQRTNAQTGLPQAANGYFVQNFHVAIPMIGSLGVNNPNMYYLGLGNTRISLFVDNPINAFYLPNYNTLTVYKPTATTPTVVSEVSNCGGLSLSSFAITRARFCGNVIRLDDSVMQQVIQLMQPVNGQQLVTKCTSFGVSTQVLPAGSSGMSQLAMNIRRGSVKSVLTLFNNTSAIDVNGTAKAFVTANGTGTTSIEKVTAFGKYGSINPGLGANTLMLINNVNYPKLGLNPTQFPEDTLAYIYEGLELLNSDDMKPSILTANWLVADPGVLLQQTFTTAQGQGDLSTKINSSWRSGVVISSVQSLTAGVTSLDKYAFAQISTHELKALIPQNILDGQGFYSGTSPFGNEQYVSSNEFFLYFNLEDQPRPGMISGKNTMDGSNFLSLNIIAPTAYAYTVYFIVVYDALLVHDFADRNVYYVS